MRKFILLLVTLGSVHSVSLECQWTRWFDRDNPGGKGDWETPLSALGQGTCENPLEVEARRVSDKKPAEQTGQVFRLYDNVKGFACVNKEQPGGRRCDDYELRLCCPLEIETTTVHGCDWTPWLDRDNPGGTGDWESPFTAFGPQACTNPFEVKARRIKDKKEASTTGEVFKYYDATNGFVCLNRDQPDRSCDDYELKLCCPHDETTTVETTTESLDCDWTRWFDRDNPGGKGDWETPLSALGQGTCENPLRVEARRVSDKKPAEETGEAFNFYDTTRGFACVNNKQPDRRCDDYEIRLCCPPPEPACSWTRWFDRDNPGGEGDWETPFSALGQGSCDNPTKVEARRVSDKKPAEDTGELFRFYDTTRGFACVNNEQADRRCDDYELRLCCP